MLKDLLLDFSDVLQVSLKTVLYQEVCCINPAVYVAVQINVYALGRAYLKLATALHINPPAIGRCIYYSYRHQYLDLASAKLG